ncbi:MAG: methylated-DNA--[protein]-cysteine S-methyltransferase [Myxococcales bacterium]|nr:methylated-DNA--[protein]-cysteine S-methyltransferase [Myxococcales bacterium]
MTSLPSLRFPSPLGPLLLVATDAGLAACAFTDPGDDVVRALARRKATLVPGRHPHLDAAREWLTAYFAGDLDRPRPLLDAEGSEFAHIVWRALCAIPAGATRSYGDLAQSIGRAGAARAVGAANHVNPIGIIVPCHRVIGRTGALTGYGGGIERKSWLLDHEARHTGQRLALPPVSDERCARTPIPRSPDPPR